MLTSLAVAAVKFATKLFVVREILAVLLVLAAATMTVVVFGIVFVLIREVIRWAALWAKIGVVRLAKLIPQGRLGHAEQNAACTELAAIVVTKHRA
jgi:hypothetical protein